MDFEIVKRQIYSAYKKRNPELWKWSLSDYVHVFEVFYHKYRYYLNRDHPRMTNESIFRVMLRLSIFSELNDSEWTADENIELMDSYFETDFTGCDYSIAHFVSGEIRNYRLFENM